MSRNKAKTPPMRQTALGLTLLLAATGCGPREVRVTMNADNNSGQSGFAVLKDLGKSLTVEVETSAPDFEGTQNVHLHEGNCGEVGEIRAPLLSLAPTKPGRVGSTSTEVRKTTGELLTFEEVTQGEWLINVHDARENSLYVSCGEVPNR